MGAPAIAALSSWIPEDDILLKNSVEAGASLESLAKGAVRFSRRFTVQELEERWRSLLYDPIVSVDAAARMVDYERTSSTLPLKSCTFDFSNDNRYALAKRKAESVYSCYHAIRKIIRSEPFNSMDMGFLIEPNHTNYNGNGDEPISENCMLGNSTTHHFEFQQDADVNHNPYAQAMMDGAVTSGTDSIAPAFQPEHVKTTDALKVEQYNLHKESPQVQGDLSPSSKRSRIEEMGEPEEEPIKMFEVDNVESKPHTTENICSGFGGHSFNSPVSDSGVSFHNLGYSSPLPDMSIWTTIESLSAPTMPMDDNFTGNNQCEGNTFALPDNGDIMHIGISAYDVGPSDSQLQSENRHNDLKSSAEDYLERLSSSLLDLMSEDEGNFIGVDGSNTIDKSYYDGLSSLLLNSPNDVDLDNIPNITNLEASVAPVPSILTPDGIYPEEVHLKACFHNIEGQKGADTNNQMPSSTQSLNSQFPEIHNGLICCVLNTEDPEIPCNADVPLPNQTPSYFNSVALQNVCEANNMNPLFVGELSDNCKPKARASSILKRERENIGQPHSSSAKGLGHPLDDYGIQLELPKFESCHVMSRSLNVASDSASQIHLENTIRSSFLPKLQKEETLDHGSNKSHPHTSVSFRKQETDTADTTATVQNDKPYQVGLGSRDTYVQEPTAYYSTSDQEEQIFDSDDDIPYFSDVEAMILDMDLGPEDQDVYFSREVLRYQHNDAKREIMRLDQAARAYMQRAIITHGSFAVLYGRNSKHYLKKSEVLVGRATEDTIVDIDLRREGFANKVSRRQAMIRMGNDGTFSMRNLGKRSIFVNSQEVASGQSVKLHSGSLVEIQGMALAFETNQTCVKLYLDNLSREGQTQ